MESTAQLAHQAQHHTSALSVLALTDQAHDEELTGLTLWVEHLLLPVHGRESTTTDP